MVSTPAGAATELDGATELTREWQRCFHWSSRFLTLTLALFFLFSHALIGDSVNAASQLLGRVKTAPALGYRFPGFAPHEQDFEPSADHFANMNRALQEMLIQSGDDGFANTKIVLFPAWPCDWDVDMKLWGPLKTSVEIKYAGGKLVSMVVEPAERASAVLWANCVKE